MKDKRGKRWSGRMEEQGSFRAAVLLNSSAGVQRGWVSVGRGTGIFNNPWEGYTLTENTRKDARQRVHRGWHFLSAPLFLLPGSPWHQRQQDSLPARGNERSSWRGEERGPGEEGGDQEEKRKKADAEAGTLTQPPYPPNRPLSTTTRGWNLNPLALTPLIPSQMFTWFLYFSLLIFFLSPVRFG